MIWTPESEGELTDLILVERMTMQAIAAKLQIVSGLPCTKNAICGKVNRLRKAGRLPPAAPRRANGPYKARQPKPAREPAVVPTPAQGGVWPSFRELWPEIAGKDGKPMSGFTPHIDAILPDAPPPEPAPEMSRIRAPEISAPSNPAPGVLLMELRDHHCRWPLWGNTERPNVFTSRSCGERITGKGPYCPACAARNAPSKIEKRMGGGRGYRVMASAVRR